MNLKSLFILLFFATLVKGQENAQIFYFHSTNQVSSCIIKPQEGTNTGIAFALNITGDTIYKRLISSQHLLSNVQFKHHENGAISRALYTARPDGGIQKTEIIDYFDPQGLHVKTEDLSTDQQGKPQILDLKPQKTTETSTCAIIYVSSIEIQNHTKHSLSLKTLRKPTSCLGCADYCKLDKNEKKFWGKYIEAQIFTHPSIWIELLPEPSKKQKFDLSWTLDQEEATGRTYILHIHKKRK
jgi:hypothetical protein